MTKTPESASLPPTAEGGALRSQDLRTAGDPVTLDGTILRVDPLTDDGLSDNPRLTATDSDGLQQSTSVLLQPRTHTVIASTSAVTFTATFQKAPR